jgi:hypothetical protein
MTRRNGRRFQVEFLEGRTALSHFGAHALVAHAVVHKAQTGHQEVQSVDRHESSPTDSSKDASNDSSADTTKDLSIDSTKDPSSRG